MKLQDILMTIVIPVIAAAVFAGACNASEVWIRDDDGRAIILHGINISNAAKWAPDRISWHEFGDYERMKTDWGFNAVRYLIFWDAIEPEPGVYDEEYLDKVAERVAWADSLGLFVILDMHQDIYGPKYGGDGAPDWAAWDDGLYYDYIEPWWLNYMWPAVRRAFTSLWTEDVLQEHFQNAWAHVAARFADHPAVLGFEILNEPFCGEILPRNFEFNYLDRFYTGVIDAIREVAPDQLVFYEPHVTTNWGSKSRLGVLPREGLAYAPHYYHPLVHEGLPYLGNSWNIRLTMKRRDSEANLAKVPWILGEFGVMGDTEGMGEYLNDILRILDGRLAGWTYWCYDYGSSHGFGVIEDNGEEGLQLQYLVRPYARRIAGDPVKMSYSTNRNELYVEFDRVEGVTGPTEIYTTGERRYPDGIEVECSDPAGSWSFEYEGDTGILEVWTPDSPGSHRILVSPAA